MTAPARISKADMDRAIKSARDNAGEKSRVVMDFAQQRITVIIGEGANDSDEPNPWDELLK